MLLEPRLMSVPNPSVRFAARLPDQVTQATFGGAREWSQPRTTAAGALLDLQALVSTQLLIARAINLEDGGRVLFCQQRPGKVDLLFPTREFRFAEVDDDQRRIELKAADEAARL